MTTLLALSPNLMVENVAKSIEFYQKHLSFEVINSIPSDEGFVWAMLKRGNVTIMLHEKNNMTAEYPVFDKKPIFSSTLLYIVVDNIKSLYENMDKHFIIKKLHTTFYKMQEFAIHDNNGYVITFAQAEAL